MSVIEKLSTSIGNKITIVLEKDEEFEEVLVYGAINLFQTIYAILVVLLLGFIFGVFFEAFIISFIMAFLRKYSGGVHASSVNKCAIFGGILATSLALISKYILIKSFGFISLFAVAAFIFLYYIVYAVAPVDSLEKPIKNIEMRKNLKSGALKVISYFLLLSIILLIINYFKNNEVIFNLSYCILMGLLAQGFSLTKVGHKSVTLVDNYFK